MKEPENIKEPELPDEKTPAGVPVSSEPPPQTPQVAERHESKFASFMRTLLRWLLAAVIFFVAGGLVVYFLLYRPLSDQLSQTQEELTLADQQILDLQAQVEQKNVELQAQVDSQSSLVETNTELEGEIASQQTHLLILSAQSDVLEANLALANDDVSGARTALSLTDETLAELKSLITDPDQQATVTRLEDRLATVLGEIEQDAATAEVDLALMVDNLKDLENLLFATP